jgi:hypothetical protein
VGKAGHFRREELGFGFVLAVLGFELRTFHLKGSCSYHPLQQPCLCWFGLVLFEIGSLQLFALVGFELRFSSYLPPE